MLSGGNLGGHGLSAEVGAGELGEEGSTWLYAHMRTCAHANQQNLNENSNES
jgi:hypothetical protein